MMQFHSFTVHGIYHRDMLMSQKTCTSLLNKIFVIHQLHSKKEQAHIEEPLDPWHTTVCGVYLLTRFN